MDWHDFFPVNTIVKPYDVKSLIVRALNKNEIKSATDLTWSVFLEFEAPEYSKEGVMSFYDYISDENQLEMLTFYGAFDENTLVGVLAFRGDNHISLFFIKKEYHRKGIGRALFEYALKEFRGEKITVNSSPYGAPFYHKLGFTDVDTEQTTDGIRYIPMVYNI